MNWVLQSNKVDGAAAFHIWLTLFRSKVTYATNLISIFSKNTRKWYKGYMYRSIKALLGIKEKPAKELLFELCLGTTFEAYLKVEQQNTMSRMLNYAIEAGDRERQKRIEDFCSSNELGLPERKPNGQLPYQTQSMPLKLLLQEGLQFKLKWQLKVAFVLRSG